MAINDTDPDSVSGSESSLDPDFVSGSKLASRKPRPAESVVTALVLPPGNVRAGFCLGFD
jgi:hypothetical protein